MAISVTCTSCGSVAQAPDTAAGSKGKCKKCGSVIAIPAKKTAAAVPTGMASQVGSDLRAGARATAASGPKKICTTCGIDVSGKKRVKDPQGHYYCQPCWEAKAQAAASRGARVLVGASAASLGAGGAAAAGGEESLDYLCSACGILGGPDDVYEDNGKYVCKICWDAGAGASAPAAAAPGARHAAGGADDVVSIEEFETADAQGAALPPLPDSPPPLPASPGAPTGSGAYNPDVLFCERCNGSFPMSKLTTGEDGAVLCKPCVAARKKEQSRKAKPAASAAAAYPTRRSGGGFNAGGAVAATGGGTLFVVFIVIKAAGRGCRAINRLQDDGGDEQTLLVPPPIVMYEDEQGQRDPKRAGEIIPPPPRTIRVPLVTGEDDAVSPAPSASAEASVGRAGSA